MGSVALVTQSTASGTRTTYPLRDHQGSVVAQVDAGGSPMEYLDYSVWGERLQGGVGGTAVDDSFAALVSPRGYTDHEHLDGVRLIHMNGRVYDPELGRFMSPDPLVQAPDNTQSFNRYSYVFNNPTSFTDPSGFACIAGMSVGLFGCGDSRAINIGGSEFGSFISASIGPIGIDLNQFGLLPVDGVARRGAFSRVTKIEIIEIARANENSESTSVSQKDKVEPLELTAQKSKTLTIGFRGAGGENSGNNASFKKYVESLGGNVLSVSEAKEAILNAPEGTDINLLGYSRGGNAAVRVTNWAGKRGININGITTFDPHSLRGNFTLKYDNVGTATNYYQRNPTTGGFGILPRGTNPYLGRSVSSQFITVGGQNYTGNVNVNHINIVSHVTGF